MRIALIAPLVTPIAEIHLGGAQAVLADLARALVGRGHDVAVYASSGSAIHGVTVIDAGIDAGSLRGDLFRAGDEGHATAAMTAAYGEVYAHVQRGGYDMVHNHGFDAPAVTVAAAMGIGVLHTLHLPPAATIAAAVDGARARGRPAVRCAAVSRAHAAAWERLIPLDGVLRNGVPIEEIPFCMTAGSAAVIAARLSPEKGVADAIAAARLAGWPVDVYGTPYDAAYEASLRAQWVADPAVRFRAPVARAALWNALGQARAVLCLSRWQEPFGMVAAEAQAAGTPVVASNVGGLGEVVSHGLTGHLVPAADVAAAAAALGRIDSLSRQVCRAHARATLNLRDTVSAHETMYARLRSEA